MIPTKTGYSLHDVMLVPKRSGIASRLDTDVRTFLTTKFLIQGPLVSSNMSTITELEMLKAMHTAGGSALLHRFMSAEDGAKMIRAAKAAGVSPVVGSIGVGNGERERADLLIAAGADIILIDIAHGHSDAVLTELARLRTKYPAMEFIVGNIATYDAAKEFLAAGAAGLRVGIGGGSRCITRTVTGHGVPNLTALVDVVRARDEHHKKTKKYVPIMIDGGIRTSGDITKALYFGADTACVGLLLSGTTETPGKVISTKQGKVKKYYGMASREAQETHRNGMKKGTAAEGISEVVPFRGSAIPIVEELTGGVRSGLTYSGAKTIAELRAKGEAILLTVASQGESKLR